MGRLVIFTGAGISADSGIQTFRGQNGLWENHRIKDVATYHNWKSKRDVVHSFYNARRAQLPLVQPNAAHFMLARLQRDHDAVMITQNIDDLLERAGCTDVIHVHGKLDEMKCEASGHVWSIGHAAWDPEVDRCPKSGSRRGVKPNVIMFGEPAPLYPKMWKTFKSLTTGDVLLVMGTSGTVVPVGDIAATSLATSILSNLDSGTGVSLPHAPAIEDRQFDVVLHGPAALICAEIERIVADALASPAQFRR